MVSRLLRIHHITSTKCLAKYRQEKYLGGIHITFEDIIDLSGVTKTYCDVFANRLKIAINTIALFVCLFSQKKYNSNNIVVNISVCLSINHIQFRM